MSAQEILLEKKEGIATITLNRPEKMNAFTLEMIDRWVNFLQECQQDDAVKVIVLTGKGKAFCTGGDLELLEKTAKSTPLASKNLIWKHIQKIPLLLWEVIDKPVIAAINGTAVGAGLDMALMCDLRFAAESARFSEGYIRLGLVPGDGGAYFLPRLIGIAKALELLWTGDFIDAREAHQLGLVNRVYPDDKLLEETYKFAERLVKGPEVAIRMIKRAVYQGLRMDLRAALDLISSHFAIAQFTDDHREGLNAIKERRPPVFLTEDK
ncbi:enoyl-CoA hydratase [Carboxydothermus islandicus]|uniref:Enoyl-CoA hydratase n=1 Tax=Carboxydothermus islandicus TaxID=661089 RepID=A0A1L8D074_9THEO|nr:enoyl-CoA hydratase-related protein [Carboxydothermus islandicus]GAV24511.1 enoyl-CoA hydratase [Carboxydothermus islandicus]